MPMIAALASKAPTSAVILGLAPIFILTSRLSLTASWSVIVDLAYSVDPQLGHVLSKCIFVARWQVVLARRPLMAQAPTRSHPGNGWKRYHRRSDMLCWPR